VLSYGRLHGSWDDAGSSPKGWVFGERGREIRRFCRLPRVTEVPHCQWW
jgi:hypothetical protein